MRRNPVGRLERILANRIREIAAEKGVPLSHVADLAGVSRSLLWEIFNQHASPSLDVVQRLGNALDLEDPLELLRGQPAPARRKATPRKKASRA